MTDHLPECLTPDPASPEILCICDRLRACEARVREEYADDRYGPAYRGALQAARDAVAACIHGPGGYHPATALAAIDALREAPHVDPCDCDRCRAAALRGES